MRYTRYTVTRTRIHALLLDLYTDQIMDNVIRQHNGLPIIQLDYINANATLTITGKASTADTVMTVSPGVLSILKTSMATVANTTMNTVTPSMTGDRSNQVQVTAVPVITSDAVYDAYREFLALPGSLQQSCEPPPPSAMHLCKKCDRVYYLDPDRIPEGLPPVGAGNDGATQIRPRLRTYSSP